MTDLDVVVWDFDGVLNKNFVDGRFIWADSFERDIGLPFEPLQKKIFGGPIKEVMTGRLDLLDLIQQWADDVGYQGSAEALLDYWFAKDNLVDPDTLRILEEAKYAGLRQVIATNNEARRSRYIEQQMGFAARINHLFSSGRLGFAKPDPAFFETISTTLNVRPERLLLVDDHQPNITAARSLGWRVFHFQPACYDSLTTALGLTN